MNQAMIYHGGGMLRGRGFYTPPATPYIPNTIRIDLQEKAWHYANNLPIVSALHTVPNDVLFGYKTPDFDQGEGAFTHFALPHRDWTHVLTGSTAIRLIYNFYHELTVAAPNNIAHFTTAAYIFRPGETCNFAKTNGVTFTYDAATTAPYETLHTNLNNFTIVDPAATGAAGECMIYIAIRRSPAGPNDTYAHVVRMLGATMEFPLA